MSAGKLGNSEILCIEVAKVLNLKHWDEVDSLSVEQCKWCLEQYESGNKPTYEDVLNYKG